MEVLQETLQQLICVVNPESQDMKPLVVMLDARPLSVFSNDPDHARPRLRLVQSVQVLTERRYDALVLVGILPEYVLDDDHGLLQQSSHYSYLYSDQSVWRVSPGQRS